MIRQIKYLTRLELCNFGGINVMKNTRDKAHRRKNKIMAVTIAFVLLVALGYICGIAYLLASTGNAKDIPVFVIGLTGMITLLLYIFKAGGIIYGKKGYDMLVSLPVSKTSIVLARFIRMYVTGLAVSALIILPGMIVYSVYGRLTPFAYPLMFVCIISVPMLSLAISAGVSALVWSVASGMKHKALVEALLMLCVIVLILSASMTVPADSSMSDMENLKNMAGMMADSMEKSYLPSGWLGDAVNTGDLPVVLGFLAISLGLLGVAVGIISWKFYEICTRLNEKGARNNYSLSTLEKSTVMRAMVNREAKRYFSSGVYITNTVVGPVMGIAFSVALFFIDFEMLASKMPVVLNLRGAIPFIMGGVFTILTPSCVSISMEGREWWIIRSLPVSKKQIFDSKIIFSICFQMPFYIVSQILAIIALRPTAVELPVLVLVPATIIVLTSVLGIAVNCRWPKMKWDNEVEVVKQSIASFVGGFAGILIGMVCMACVLPLQGGIAKIMPYIMEIVLLLTTIMVYNRNNNRAFDV